MIKYICEFCDDEFPSRKKAEDHIREVHGDWIAFISSTWAEEEVIMHSVKTLDNDTQDSV